jgi:hypothetical protein
VIKARTRLRERPHERADPVLVARLDDHVERVLTLDDCLSLDGDAVLPDVGPAEVVEKHRARVRVGGRTPLGVMPVTDDEQSH